MKQKLQLLYGIFIFCSVFLSNKGYSQINYSEDFETEEIGGWSQSDFYYADFIPCEGTGSMVGEMYSLFGDVLASETISPSLGISNGQLATLTYSYKLYDALSEMALTNSPDWGNFTIEYSASASGPWTTIQTISSTSHVESEDCAVQTATFTPSGGNLYLRIKGNPNANEEFLYFALFIDDLTVTQAPSLDCEGTPAAAVTIAAKSILCNGQSASLSLDPYPITNGIEIQWQSSLDGIEYADVAGGTEPTLTAEQTVSTWYRANITCAAGGDTVTSSFAKVVSSGLECLCEVEFEQDIEPITRVTFAGIDNGSSATVNGTPGIEDFTGIAPGQVIPGLTYPIFLEGNTNGENFDNYFKVYIDFNHNGNLNDPGESFEIGFITGSSGEDGDQATDNIQIPITATTGLTYMRVFKLYDEYSEGACVSEDGYGYGQVEDYLIDIQPCTTVEPEVAMAQTFCSGATVANLVADGADIKWYALPTGGFALNSTQALVNNKTYYVTQTVGCESARVAVTVTINTITVDDLDDATACLEYVLPALENGAYYTEPNGGGEMLEAGAGVIESKTIYIYAQVGTDPVCKAETSFVVTINNVEADELEDVEVCSEYVLPVLEHGKYYTEPGGEGDMLEAGNVITETSTIYIYAVSETDPACTVNNSFVITITKPIPPAGDHTIVAEESFPLSEIDLEAEGTITWYSNLEDAKNGENSLSNDQMVPVGTTTYYATQTIEGCESDPYEVVVEVVLGTEGFDMTSFKYYPNPVNDILNVSYSNTITNLIVFNLLGQQVFTKAINQTNAQLDLSQIASGTYMVKVQTENAFKMIKVVKR